jgi:hypothetical protein
MGLLATPQSEALPRAPGRLRPTRPYRVPPLRHQALSLQGSDAAAVNGIRDSPPGPIPSTSETGNSAASGGAALRRHATLIGSASGRAGFLTLNGMVSIASLARRGT